MLDGTLEVYTDGSSRPNPGKGGWAFVIHHHKKTFTGNGRSDMVTNNQMELQACIEALYFIDRHRLFDINYDRILIKTDSQYVCNGAMRWLPNWMKNGMKTASGGLVANHEQWLQIHELKKYYPVAWQWVRGHDGNQWNEVCDKLAKEAIEV